MKHKLLIDATPLLSPPTGIGRYAYEIAKRIQKSQQFNTFFYYGYYSKNLLDPTGYSKFKNLKNLIDKSRFFKKNIRLFLLLAHKLYLKKFDLYWQPNFIPNENIKAKKIVTSVHDFSFILYRDFHPKERIEFFEKYFFKNIYKSDIIITGSNFTKYEILKYINISEEKIKVVYHGVNHNIYKKLSKVETDIILPKKFILSVGSLEPRKNLIGLLDAYEMLPLSVKKEYHLVLVGFKGWNNQKIMKKIEKNKPFVKYIGYLPEKNLAIVYNKSSLFVYPSFYEGFGLPPLEAMACGTPVIISNSSSLPEVGGDAVVYCDPYNTEDIKEKIEKVLSDKTLQTKMIEKGLRRANMFTWEKSAMEHINVFQETLRN